MTQRKNSSNWHEHGITLQLLMRSLIPTFGKVFASPKRNNIQKHCTTVLSLHWRGTKHTKIKKVKNSCTHSTYILLGKDRQIIKQSKHTISLFVINTKMTIEQGDMPETARVGVRLDGLRRHFWAAVFAEVWVLQQCQSYWDLKEISVLAVSFAWNESGLIKVQEIVVWLQNGEWRGNSKKLRNSASGSIICSGAKKESYIIF